MSAQPCFVTWRAWRNVYVDTAITSGHCAELMFYDGKCCIHLQAWPTLSRISWVGPSAGGLRRKKIKGLKEKKNKGQR